MVIVAKRNPHAGTRRLFFPNAFRMVRIGLGVAILGMGCPVSAEAAAPGADAAVEEAAYRLGPLARTRVEFEERMGHEPGQGFRARQEEARTKLAEGNAAMQAEDFAGAKACYEAALAAAGWLQTNAPLRTEVLEKRAAASELRRKAVENDGPHLGLISWREGEVQRETAMEAYERGEFAVAGAAWDAAAAAYRRADAAAKSAIVERGLEAARGARRLGAWEEVLAAVGVVLAQEPKNAEALALKKEARAHEKKGRRSPGKTTVRAEEKGVPETVGALESVAGAGTLGVGMRAGESRIITLPGGATMEMAWCPPGSFTMGSTNGFRDEQPPHEVTLTKGFWMAKTEVTQGQWTSVMGRNPKYTKGDNYPVDGVSWYDCQNFCRNTGLELPTEAEWEYACRAGTVGDYAGSIDQMAWYGRDWGAGTHVVGRKNANAWGLYDMHGNVWEWCADWYDSGYYASSPGTDPQGPASGKERVRRGGGVETQMQNCRAARRVGCDPGWVIRYHGFRPVARPN